MLGPQGRRWISRCGLGWEIFGHGGNFAEYMAEDVGTRDSWQAQQHGATPCLAICMQQWRVQECNIARGGTWTFLEPASTLH